MAANVPAGREAVLVTGIEGFTGASMRAELESAGYRVVGTTHADPQPGERVLDIESPDAVPVGRRRGRARLRDPPRRHQLRRVRSGAAVRGERRRHRQPARRAGRVADAAAQGRAREQRERLRQPRRRPARRDRGAAAGEPLRDQQARDGEDGGELLRPPADRRSRGRSTTPASASRRTSSCRRSSSHFARGATSIELGNIDVERDFSDVAMVVEVYRKLLESPLRSSRGQHLHRHGRLARRHHRDDGRHRRLPHRRARQPGVRAPERHPPSDRRPARDAGRGRRRAVRDRCATTLERMYRAMR